MRLGCSYSGGKDCTLAMYKEIKKGNEVVCLITTADENKSSLFHDLDFKLLQELANRMDIALEYIIVMEGENYTEKYEEGLTILKKKYQLEGIIFGDIDIKEHLHWTKARCDHTGLRAINPLWQEERKKVVREFLDMGFKAKIKKVNKVYLHENIVDKELDYEMLVYFEELGIDECGENGEFHTIAYDGPLFKKAFEFQES